MKRLLSFIIVISCAGFVLAQDIIALKSGERIEDANVQSVTDKEIVYIQNGNTISIPHNSAEAILYADGRYEEIKATVVGDPASIAAVEELGYNAEEVQAMMNNGDDRKMLLWKDKSYPKECRKEGKKKYYSVFKELYTPAFQEAKADGYKTQEAMQYALEKAFMPALKASNEVVRECNGGMYSVSIVSEPIQNTPDPVYEQSAVSEEVYYEPIYEEPVYEQPIEMVVEEKVEVPVEQPKKVVEGSDIIFTADKKHLSFSAAGGSQQVHVEANRPWEIYSSPDWTEVRRLGGRLTIICAENSQFSDREEDLVLRIKSGQIIRIIVTQGKRGR